MLLNEFWYRIYPLDPIVSAFQEAFPEHGITHETKLDESKFESISKNMHAFLRWMISWYQEYWPFVIEGFHMDPDSIYDDYKNDFKIIFFWYPNINSLDKLKAIRENDINEWTCDLSDDELLENIKFNILMSRKFEDFARINDIKFIDTSFDFQNSLKEALFW